MDAITTQHGREVAALECQVTCEMTRGTRPTLAPLSDARKRELERRVIRLARLIESSMAA